MGKQWKIPAASSVGGFGLGLGMWLAEMTKVHLEPWTITILAILAFVMVSYGAWGIINGFINRKSVIRRGHDNRKPESLPRNEMAYWRRVLAFRAIANGQSIDMAAIEREAAKLVRETHYIEDFSKTHFGTESKAIIEEGSDAQINPTRVDGTSPEVLP